VERDLIRALGLVAALAVMVGCAAQEQPAADRPPEPDIPAPQQDTGPAVNVRVYDERGEVSEPGRLLYMPQTTIVGQTDDVYPVIDEATRRLIQTEAAGHFGDGTTRYRVDIYVTAGRQSFRVEEMREVVAVDFAVRIEMVNERDPSDVRVGEGSASISDESVDIARATVEAMYAEAIRQSLRRGLEAARR
jgi:hypothetical protein